MRKREILAALSAIALAASCSKDAAPLYTSDPDAVRVEAVVGAVTRSNPIGTAEEQASFNEGDEIAVSNGGDFLTYTLSGGSWTPKDPSRYLRWDTDEMTFRAYYPAVDNSYDKGVLYSGQDDEGTLRKSDYMTAEARMNRRSETGNALTLKMARRAARVAVKVSGYRDEFEGGNPEVTGVRVYTYLTVPAGGSSEAVGAYKRKEDGKDVFYALVCPGDASPYQTFLELTVEYGDPRQSKTLTVTGVPAMEAGKSYTYSVTVGKTTAKVGSVSVIDWTGGAAIDDGLTDVVLGWSGNAEPFAETDASGKTLGDSEASPILIGSAEQLAWLAQQVNKGNSYKEKYFKLADDINLANKPWTPIGCSVNDVPRSFSGHFDGNNKSIYGLNVSSAGYAGLFGHVAQGMYASKGSIRNVRIEAARIACERNNAAVLCGYAGAMTIDNCSVRGSVESSGGYVGGLVGECRNVTMTDCTAEVSVNGTFYVGGLCGSMYCGSISDCSVVNSRVEGTDDAPGGAGGLCGNVQVSSKDDATVAGCSVTGCVIKGKTDVGGLLGLTYNTQSSEASISISGCTASADLTVTGGGCGGIVGHTYGQYEAKFSGCGFDGTITNENDGGSVGAAVGFDESPASEFSGCWYNSDKTGELEAVGNKASDKDYSGITARN